jgi:WD40 repeat protein
VPGEHFYYQQTLSDESDQNHQSDSPSVPDISLLLRDAQCVMRVYATPIRSHALQVYDSVLATGPGRNLLNSARIIQNVGPRLASARASDWSPVLQVIRGHNGGINSVACSLDESYIVSGSDDKAVRLWDAQTGKELAVLQGHGESVLSVAFSPDGAHIVSGSEDRTVRVWDAQTGKELAVLEGHSGWVRSVAFSPNGTHIVSGSWDKTVRVWDAQTGKDLAVIEGHSDAVNSVAFTPDGEHIISRDDRGLELAWNVKGTVAPPRTSGQEAGSHFCRCVRC